MQNLPAAPGGLAGRFAAPHALSLEVNSSHCPEVLWVRILIVEDHNLVAFTLADELTEAGHDVIGPARTSEEALQEAELHRPHFAFVDLDLERKAIGLEVAQRLTADLGVSVVICTGNPALARRVQSGAIGLLSKPYFPSEAVDCLAIVEAAVAGRPSSERLPPSFELLVSPQ